MGMEDLTIFSVSVWRIEDVYMNSLLENDVIYEMSVGQGVIYPFAYPIIKPISENVYDKLITGEYVLEVRLDLEELFLIKDHNGNYIPCVNGMKLPDNINSDKEKIFKKLKL